MLMLIIVTCCALPFRISVIGYLLLCLVVVGRGECNVLIYQCIALLMTVVSTPARALVLFG